MKYAIFLEVDSGEWDYLRVKENGCWTIQSPIHLFDSKEDAVEECKQYNTATVVEYQYNESK